MATDSLPRSVDNTETDSEPASRVSAAARERRVLESISAEVTGVRPRDSSDLTAGPHCCYTIEGYGLQFSSPEMQEVLCPLRAPNYLEPVLEPLVKLAPGIFSRMR